MSLQCSMKDCDHINLSWKCNPVEVRQLNSLRVCYLAMQFRRVCGVWEGGVIDYQSFGIYLCCGHVHILTHNFQPLVNHVLFLTFVVDIMLRKWSNRDEGVFETQRWTCNAPALYF
ncbi:uncharacterized protein LOC113299486 [Papaver somniferum]|uniref:uncharacterized protein LOC113299486 n=1 Tax=Papaver somniferum TaxID=3469 RepID=UPI000E6F6B00|nr:uncharacterized protein LOC113299486 [Papaver somniferum]